MSIKDDKNIRVPTAQGMAKDNIGSMVNTAVVSVKQGIRAIVKCETGDVLSYIFSKNKNWTLEKARLYEKESSEEILKSKDTCNDWIKSSDSFALTEENIKFTLGIDQAEMSDFTQIIKFDFDRQIVHGVFLVPDKPDHHGDVIAMEDVEYVAHDFLKNYRAVDEMHGDDTIEAEVIESAIASEDMSYHGKSITKGAWFGAIKINDSEVWEKVKSKKYRAFSVRVYGKREKIEDGEKQ